MTFMIEGEWSGYHSGQRRVVHREFTGSRERADKISALRFIRYTDGTTLDLSVKQYQGRRGQKRPPAIDGYSSLIASCLMHNVNSVDALQRKKAAGV